MTRATRSLVFAKSWFRVRHGGALLTHETGWQSVVRSATPTSGAPEQPWKHVVRAYARNRP